MALKRVSNKVEVFTIDGTEIHAVKPNKAVWDEYVDELFVREGKELVTKSAKGLKALYRLCVKKIVNIDYEVDGKINEGATVTDSDTIVDILANLNDADAGRKIDSWLLGLGELTAPEVKNSVGVPPVA